MTEKATREGSPVKRKAILDAARDLFVRQGVDRVSMDAVAAQAKVSKATVYEYFGDKRRLFLAILTDASSSLEALAQRSLEQHLHNNITTVPDLEKALTATAVDLGVTMIGSPEYAAAFGLVSQQRLRVPSTDDDVATDVPEAAITERIAHYVNAGLLETDNPRLAAAHFGALTILLAFTDQPDPSRADLDRVRQTVADGVHAFVRAYGVR